MLQKLFPLIISVSLLLLPCMAAISFRPFAVADATQPEVADEVLRDDVEQPDFPEPPLQDTDSTENSAPADDTENKSAVIAPVFYHSTIYDANGEPENQFTVQAGSEGIDEGSIITTVTYINDIEIGKVNFTVAKRIGPFAKVAHNLSVGIPKDLTNPSGKVTAAVYLNDVKLGLGENKDNTIKVFDPKDIKTLNFTVPITDTFLARINAESIKEPFGTHDIFMDIDDFDIDYSYSETNSIPYLDATCAFTNNTGIKQGITFTAALYDDKKLLTMITDSINVNNNYSDEISLSLDLSNATENSYVKLFVWEGMGTIRPLNITRTITDIISVSYEKVVVITKQSGEEFDIFLSTSGNKSINGKTHTITYDPTKFQLVDLCSLTEVEETTACIIDKIGLEFTSVTSGEIRFTVTDNSPMNTKLNALINAIRFKPLTSVSAEEIKYIVE